MLSQQIGELNKDARAQALCMRAPLLAEHLCKLTSARRLLSTIWRAVTVGDSVWNLAPELHVGMAQGEGLAWKKRPTAARYGTSVAEGDQPQRPNKWPRGSESSQTCSLGLHLPIPHQIFAHTIPPRIKEQAEASG